jgi:hypothetical protein
MAEALKLMNEGRQGLSSHVHERSRARAATEAGLRAEQDDGGGECCPGDGVGNELVLR